MTVKDLRLSVDNDDLLIDVSTVADQHLKVVTGSAEHDYVERLIRTATRMGEAYTGRSFLPKTWVLTLDSYPSGTEGIALPKAPIIEIVSAVYTDTDGDDTTLEAETYVLRKKGRERNEDGLVVPAANVTWPTANPYPASLAITYRAGYVTDTSPEAVDVPEDLIHGVLLTVAELYKTRSLSVHASNLNAAPILAKHLWQPYRIYGEA